MLLSLVETIVMMYLIEKDSAAHHNKMDEEQNLSVNCGDKWCKANFCVRGEIKPVDLNSCKQVYL